MSVSWTEEQEKVIRLHKRNILVSAAAGSGKTAVLVERIIRMLIDENQPIDVDRLLVVTFTEAAAAEMKERIRNAIEKELELHPENEHLKQQATLIHTAQITTIHSFCLSVIRDHFSAIDLDPGFRIAEEGELKLLKRDVLNELLEEKYKTAEARFLQFVDSYAAGKTDKKIEEMILSVYEYVRSYPDETAYLERCVKSYQPKTSEELQSSPYMIYLRENLEKILNDLVKMIDSGIAMCNEPDGPMVYESVLQSDLDMIKKWKYAENYEEMYKVASDISWKRMPVNRDKTVSEEKIVRIKALREDVKTIVKDLADDYFSKETGQILEESRRCEPMMEELKDLVLRFSELFQKKKAQKNMIDFSDMEHFALQILTENQGSVFKPSQIAKEYQDQFAEIMIDEYQDSNLIQETILRSISGVSIGNNNIFMVGDVKQSIYRFRLSRPELFMEKYNHYSLEDGEEQRIDLHKNFRSRKEVLESVNGVFEQVMIPSIGGITYDESAALHVGAKYEPAQNNETEVLIVDDNNDNLNVGKGSRLSAQEIEARVLAMRIRELVKEHKITDKETKKLRKTRYSDIVILTRSISGYADVFARVLEEQGIPVCVSTREGYFSAQEICVVLDYLRIMDNEKQDIPLTAVLVSPMVGLSDQKLSLIRYEFPDIPFHEAVSTYAEEGKDLQLKQKLMSFFVMLRTLREKSVYITTQELLYELLERTGYMDFVSAMPMGAQRRANIEMLVEKAKAFEACGYSGLFQFVRYIEQLRKYSIDYGEANVEDEQSDNVRIMTIHKSKGLEFPICFVSGMGKKFNMQSVKSSVVMHSEIGIGLDVVDLNTRTKNVSIVKQVIRREEALESLAEELRVLYVAMTRAKEKLILTGTLSDIPKKLPAYEYAGEQIFGGYGFSWISRANCFWDFLIPVVLKREEELPIRVKFLDLSDVIQNEISTEMTDAFEKAKVTMLDETHIFDEKAAKEIESQFSYHYPFSESRNHRLKFSVSELKHREKGEDPYDDEWQDSEDTEPIVPGFMKGQEERLVGAARGTAYHRFMEILDFSERYDMDTLEQAIQSHVRKGKLGEDEARCINRKQILEFLNSPLGERMHKASKESLLYKEQPFVLGIDAQSIYPDEQPEELLLVQGIIDAYFEEDKELVLLDYKTDRVKSGEELVEKYSKQLDYYSQALSRITQKPVKEKVIYSFALGKDICL